jgi:hypothetical protein
MSTFFHVGNFHMLFRKLRLCSDLFHINTSADREQMHSDCWWLVPSDFREEKRY